MIQEIFSKFFLVYGPFILPRLLTLEIMFWFAGKSSRQGRSALPILSAPQLLSIC